VRKVHALGKLIGSICHGSGVPISVGIVQVRKATGTMVIKDDITNVGGIWVDASALPDGNIVWGCVVENIPNFCRELIAALEGN
jgi:protease I